jgi:hypothetical protein
MAETVVGGSAESGKGGSGKKRKWLKIALAAAGVLVVGGVGLVALTPTLLSTGAGKSFVLGQVNAGLNGRVEIESWSLGWFSGIEASGVKVYDDQKRLAVSVGKATTGLTVMKAISGDLALGDVTVEGLNLVLVEVGKDGQTNLAKIGKGGGGEVTIPALSGKVTIKAMTGTIQGEAVGRPIRIEPSDIVVKIADLRDKPIENDIKLMIKRDGGGTGGAGMVTLVGSSQVIFAGKIEAGKLTAGQKLGITNFDLGTLAPVLAMAGVKLELAGEAGGTLDVGVKGTEAVSAAGELTVLRLVAGGEVLKGDTFRSERIRVPVDVGMNGSEIAVRALGVDSAELKLAVNGAVPMSAMTNLLAGKAPGAAGNLTITAGVPDLGGLGRQLRNTMGLAGDATLTSGAVTMAAAIAIEPTSARLTGRTSVTGVRGERSGRAIAIAPVGIEHNVAVTFAGGKLETIDVAPLALSSGFARVEVRGNQNELTYSADVSLDAMAAELGQLIDFGAVTPAGRLLARGSIGGGLLSDAPLVATGRAEVTGVRLAMGEGQVLDVDRFEADTAVTIKSAGGNRFAAAEVSKLVASLGQGASPVLTVDAVANVDLVAGSAPAFDVRRMEITSLAELQRRVGPLVPALREMGIEMTGGSVSVGLAGGYAGGKLELTRPLVAELRGVSVSRQGRAVLGGETITVKAGARVETGAAGTKGVIGGLEVASSTGLLRLGQTSEKLEFEIKPGGEVSASGALAVGADVARLAQVAEAWSGQAAAQPIRSGKLEGQVAVRQSPAGTAAKGTLELSGLTVGDLIRGESVAVGFDAAVAGSAVTASAGVKSAFANVDVKDATLDLSAAALGMVKSATVTVDSSDLAKADALVKALTGGGGASLTRGSLNVAMSVVSGGGKTTVEVGTLRASGLELRNGRGSFAMPGDVNLKARAVVSGDAAGGVTGLSVPVLEGSVGVARMKLTEAVEVSDLGAVVPTVRGGVEVSGRVQTGAALLEVWQGAEAGSVYPYVGEFVLAQKLTSVNGVAGAVGGVSFTGLKVLDARGNAVFSEDRLEIANDVSVATGPMDVTIRNVSLSAASSQAVAVGVTGLVRDVNGQRRFEQPLRVKLGYDLEKLLPLVRPLMQGDLLDQAVAAGKYEREIVVGGSFPATLPPHEAFRKLEVTGGVAVQTLRLPKAGVELGGFEPTFVMKDGVLALSQAAPAEFTGGTLNVNGISVDLGSESPRVSAPKNHELVKGLVLNKVMADRFGWLGSFVFKGTTETAGRANLTLVNVDRLPLGELMKQRTPANDGSAEVNLTVKELRIIGGPLGDIVGKLPVVREITNGEIPKGRVVIANGVVTQEIVFRLSAGEMRTEGGIELASERLMPITLYIAPAFIKDRLGLIGENLRLGDLPLTITGTVSQPKYDFGAAVQTYIKNNITGLGGLGSGLLDGLRGDERRKEEGGDGKPPQPPATQPERRRNPLDLLPGRR